MSFAVLRKLRPIIHVLSDRRNLFFLRFAGYLRSLQRRTVDFFVSLFRIAGKWLPVLRFGGLAQSSKSAWCCLLNCLYLLLRD